MQTHTLLCVYVHIYVPSADPGVQNECLESGHLGQAFPSVSQICFLTHKPTQTGNQMVALLSLVISQNPTIQYSVVTPQVAVTYFPSVECSYRTLYL